MQKNAFSSVGGILTVLVNPCSPHEFSLVNRWRVTGETYPTAKNRPYTAPVLRNRGGGSPYFVGAGLASATGLCDWKSPRRRRIGRPEGLSEPLMPRRAPSVGVSSRAMRRRKAGGEGGTEGRALIDRPNVRRGARAVPLCLVINRVGRPAPPLSHALESGWAAEI